MNFTLSPTPSSVSKPGSRPDNPARITGWSAYLACPGPTGVEQALSATHSQCPEIRPRRIGSIKKLRMIGMSKDDWSYNQHLPCNYCNLERARNRWGPASSFPIVPRQADLSVCQSSVSLDGH
ncbi:hypothetical protein MCOR29_002579 [Pyricularia oryzae]|nr:hypothetical protein MCOR29_002579 [Pyricularia oryzae]KAI6341589.1 hypothetical protein MCOR28_005949 [Pyricularia oryzae]KAI6380213.1 hypothetical protein MCOR32_004151 [Pyricularia oryzae]KAI6397902.1 hypothetical protein MCOR23_005965 [Pyricularia oryzae]KAI6505175.1 hypothetical protein MCOR13_004380 [Pyricularia oryzae]